MLSIRQADDPNVVRRRRNSILRSGGAGFVSYVRTFWKQAFKTIGSGL
jgi:hypothetical protein